MQIKTTKSSSILSNLLFILGALVLMVVLVGITQHQPASDKNTSHVLSKSTTDFMQRHATIFELFESIQNLLGSLQNPC